MKRVAFCRGGYVARMLLAVLVIAVTPQFTPGCGKDSIFGAAERGDLGAVKAFVNQGVSVNADTCIKGPTVLRFAAMGGHVDVIAYLLKKGANPNELDKGGHPPVYGAIVWHHPAAARYLLEHGTNLHLRNQHGDTLLHMAAERDPDAVRFLVAHGLSPNIRDYRGNTPLFSAAARDNVATAAALLKLGADVDAKDRAGSTALGVAAFCGFPRIASFLIGHGASVNARDNDGAAPLDYVTEAPSACVVPDGDARAAEILLAHGADVNAQDNKGLTPLHYDVKSACDNYGSRYSGVAIARVLLQHGAKINAKDKKGQTPLELAESNPDGKDSIIKFLKAHGGR